MLRLLLVLSTLLPAVLAQPQAADPITADELGEHIDVLASTVFEGRGVGSRGERRAAAYLVGQLEQIDGLQPGGQDGSWFQIFPVALPPKERGEEPLTGRNVLALLPGTDPELVHETIVCGAHYDHVGFGMRGNSLDQVHEVHNGADDNASGSAVLLELAQALATDPSPPRRTILFQWYSGEELGLLGSLHYVEHPTRPLEDTVFMLNLDMVGRMQGRTLMVGGGGTSPVLPPLTSRLCDELGLEYIDDPVGAGPSDHSGFYGKDIPVLFLFTGLHGDYHRVGDDSWKINLEGTQAVGELARRTVRAIDGRDERIPFRHAPGQMHMWEPKPYFGLRFEGGRGAFQRSGGARIDRVVAHSPAERGGLRDGDVLISIDGTPVASTDEAVVRLKRIRTLHSVVIEVRRLSVPGDAQGQLLMVTVQPVIR